ncbi:glycogen/starch/alpha-glucan phosphorylase [Acholeplasma equirhinis]|uniref:glycogen/starch/alpha-glucan phosphorylase n=1 Tax=Acholeplasma equirhinis TaxID=555393 RepID=UPI00197A868A|nr:glycogen/starch/alpha-glucan phosphorylase [Acholeplasma equirhinis]MBN3490273.1 glycogen/starch/alpha-glucan phosphorylase [Acholeplasma equirhinis]
MNHIFENKETFKGAYVLALNHLFAKKIENATLYERYATLASILDTHLKTDYRSTTEYVEKNNLKKTIYFSMEFLMGRLITSNLMNAGYASVVKEAFKDWGYDLNEIEQTESDAGLGNGGLGRLAACFLDSAASLSLPLYGNSLRYQHGFFVQKIENNKQVEYPDNWLERPFIWEEKKEDEAVEVPFFGYVENIRLIDPVWVRAIPYDVKVVGAQNGVVTHLRLWSTEPSKKYHYQDQAYLNMVKNITDSLYPDDSTEDGKLLRLQQQYLFSAAGIKSAINEHKRLGRDVRSLADYYTFQINDTHPTLIIPELMRVLMDEEGLGYDEAWQIVNKTCAYTNHTILAEALEKWNIKIFRRLLPRIYEIIAEMNKRFIAELVSKGYSQEKIYRMQLIGVNNVRMANICINASFSVNGVAALHTDILKKIELNDFYQLYPEKFNNKTNGITHRRWLLHINPELTSIIDSLLGSKWQKDLSLIKGLEKYANDAKVQSQIKDMKLTKKRILIKRIYEDTGVMLNENAIFDIQIKRLHEYKRQLLNILHIIYLYLRLKKDAEFKKNFHPQNFIFGAKAAPSYHMAKGIIELINAASKVINNDKDTNELLKVVFVENYNVTYAEFLFPAADLSEQISTASKEASGTGNMKFMLNGAVTIGTMDGANVEIVEQAGKENAVIFGMSAEEVTTLYKNNGYKPRKYYDEDKRLRDIFEFIRTLNSNPTHFDFILHNLLNSDYFLVMADFASYVEAQAKANKLYQDAKTWWRMSIMNIANAGFFTSDRTIAQYNEDIWHLTPITF